jgi:hypothetical protein
MRRGADRRPDAGAGHQPDQVVAEVGGKPITLKDVDAKWEDSTPPSAAALSRRCTRIAAT